MGLSGGQQSSTQNTSPWEGQQPYLRDLFSQAQQNYNGPGPEYFSGNTVAPFSDITQAGLALQANRGASGSASESALNQYIQGTLGMPGVDPRAIAAAGGAQTQFGGMGADILADAANPNNFFNTASAAALDPSRLAGATDYTMAGSGDSRATLDNLQTTGISDVPRDALSATASGSYLNANPYLKDQYDAATAQVKEDFSDVIAPTINATFGSAGRTGSALHAQAIGDAADDLTTNLSQTYADIFGGNYQAERDRSLSAAGQLGDFDIAGGGLNLAATEVGLTDDLSRRDLASDIFFGQQGNELDYLGGAAGRALGAGSDLFSGFGSGVDDLTSLFGIDSANRQGAAGLVDTASNLDYQNIDRLLASGQITDEQAQRLIDAERARFDYYQNLPDLRLLQYSNIINANPFSQSSGGSSGFNLGFEF